jgi:hypothetical protein
MMAGGDPVESALERDAGEEGMANAPCGGFEGFAGLPEGLHMGGLGEEWEAEPGCQG